tara:strand:- start:271751 stop:272320 length:570 start_codon:yes stop_codon:yes gene_type:complete
MKALVTILGLWALPLLAEPMFFIEPGVFMNMYDGAHIEFEDDSGSTSGHIRNSDLSYAIKIGMHHGHFEYGFETEIYDYEAHLDKSDGHTTENVTITYNGIFVGYEFVKKNFLYFEISLEPYLSAGGKSYHEHKPVFSMEYSRHIKEWVSLNVKLETESEFKVIDSDSNDKVHVGNMILVGFSFPLLEE